MTGKAEYCKSILECEHEDFVADVDVTRLTKTEAGEVEGYCAEIQIRCAECGERFRFMGDLPYGSQPDQPTISPDEAELRIPIRPASSDPDFGMGLPGIGLRIRASA